MKIPEKIKAIFSKLNIYLAATIIFLAWILVFDNHNLIKQHENRKKLNELKADKAYYEMHIKKDKQRLTELKTNKENLEKFAREQYFMKKKNEVIFVVVED